MVLDKTNRSTYKVNDEVLRLFLNMLYLLQFTIGPFLNLPQQRQILLLILGGG